jgi:hypothetical protein
MTILEAYRLIIAAATVLGLVLILAGIPRWRGQRAIELAGVWVCAVLAVAYLVSALLGKPIAFVWAALWTATAVMRFNTMRLNDRTRRRRTETASRLAEIDSRYRR